MSGVEILSTAEVIIKNGFYWPVFVLLVIVTGMLMGIILGRQERNVGVGIYFGIIGALCGMALGIFPAFLIGDRDDKYETQYKVLISEEVSMSQFLEEYEIVGQEGKILTVRERNDADG